MTLKQSFTHFFNEIECHAKLCIGVGTLSIAIMILGFMWLNMGMKRVEYTIAEGTYNIMSRIDMTTIHEYATIEEIEKLKEIPNGTF